MWDFLHLMLDLMGYSNPCKGGVHEDVMVLEYCRKLKGFEGFEMF